MIWIGLTDYRILVWVSRLPILAILVALVLSGCGNAEKNEALVQPIAASNSSDFSVPASVDVSYAEAVLNKLETARGDVRRNVVSSKKFTADDQQKLNATFAEPSLSFQTKLWRDVAAKDRESKFLNNPTTTRWTVSRIVQKRSDCIWVKATSDEALETVVDVVLRNWSHDETINPTPWVISQYTPESLGAVDPGLGCDDTTDRIPPNKLREAYKNYA